MLLQEKPRAWVFGASGLTGQGIVKSLTSAGIPTHAHVRPNSSSHEHITTIFATTASIEVVPWTVNDITTALRAQPPSLVFLSLGTTKARARVDGEGYQTVDYGYTKLVIDAVRSNFPSCKLVYISSLPGGSSEYFKVRKRLEAYLQKSGAPVLIARSSLIVGDRLDERPWERRAAWFMDGCLSCLRAVGLGSVSDRFDSMSGDELGAGVVQLCLEQVPQIIAEPAEIRAASARFGHRQATELPTTSEES